jgi:actin-related protein 8
MAKTAKDRDRALAMAKANDLGLPETEADGDGDTNMEEGAEETTETLGSKVIVVHVGSQNLRIGLASDALPKTVPMVIARKSTTSESEDHDEPRPKRLKLDDGSLMEPEKMLGPEVCSTPAPRSLFAVF